MRHAARRHAYQSFLIQDAMSSTPEAAINAPASLKRVIVAHYVFAALAGLTGLFYMIGGVFSLREDAVAGVFGIIIGLLGAALWVTLNLLTVRGLKRMSNGWRVFSIIVSILSLMNFPFGTAFGIVALTGLFSTDVKEAFEAAKK